MCAQKSLFFWLVVMTSVVLLTACTTPLPAPTLLLSTQTPEPSATPNPSPTAGNPTRTPYPTRRPTVTILPTKTPTPVRLAPTWPPIPTQLANLTTREPSLIELEAFLQTRFRYWDSNGQEYTEVEIFSEDVNGDGEHDLVIHNLDTGLLVLLWAQTEYVLGLQEYVDYGRGLPTATLTLEDWTNDRVPEIVYDTTSVWGGSGWFVYITTRKTYHCEETTCTNVWEKEIDLRDDLYGWGNLERSHLQTNLLVNNGTPTIRALFEGFTVAHQPAVPDNAYYPSHFSDGLYVLTSTLTLYGWNGVTFEPVDEQIVSLPKNIPSDLQTTAVSPSGISAEVIIRQQLGMDTWRDNCQLVIGNVAMEPQFPCSNKFTRADWLDVVGDNKPEVVVTTFSGISSPQMQEFHHDSCQSQRLLIFQPTGDTYTLIANVTGCIEESDLYGVRLEDVNGDGQFEIRSRGAYWGGPELLYTFNGTTFTLSAELP